MKSIKFSLSLQSIENAVSQLNQYKDSIKEKSKELVAATANDLIKRVDEGFNGATYDDILHEGTRVPDVTVRPEIKDNKASVTAYGPEAVFAEFGAGVYYNPSGSPRPDDSGMIKKIGTYGKGYGSRDIWAFRGEDGKLKLTHGTPAAMPMFHATREEKEYVPKLAKEIFSGGDA